MKRLLFVALFLSFTARADMPRSFPAGSGARYAFSSQLGNAELTMSIAASTSARVVAEFSFTQGGFLASQLWQAFAIDVTSGTPRVTEGYLLTDGARAPERVPSDLLDGLENASVSDFLFSSRADIDPFKQGEEQLKVAASSGPMKCTRYERTTGTQVVTFWLSDEARPLGLVKLRSRGPQKADNYELELLSLLTHVGRKIDPKTAVPLTAEGRALLQTRLR